MRFVIDMNLSPRWGPFLEESGHHARHWSSVGVGDAPDQELMEFASQHGLVVVTRDLDFGTLLALGGLSAPSVIQFRTARVLPRQAGEQLLVAVESCRSELERGAVVTIEQDRYRVTELPFNR